MKRALILLTAIILLNGFVNSQPVQQDIPWVTLAKSDWAMIKHDPQFTGRSPYKGPQTPTIVWKRSLPDGIFSGPVIGEEGNLYFGSYYQLDSADYFYSYSRSGKMRWKYKLGGNRPPQSGILIDSSNTIYFGSLDKYFYALNMDGTIKWRFETSAPIVELAIPNIDLEGRLYITNGLGDLYSINNDGTLNWKINIENGFFAKSPVISPNGKTIYIAGSYGYLYAIDLNGKLKWKFVCGKIVKSPLIDSNGNIYFDDPDYFYSLSNRGEIRWKYNDFFFGTSSIPTIDENGNIYSMATGKSYPYKRQIISLDYNGNFRWSYLPDDYEYDDFWQPLICDSDGTVYFGSTNGKFYYAVSSEGKLKWKLPLNDYQVDNTAAISSDGTLYLGVHMTSLWDKNKNNLIAIRDTNTTGVKKEIKITSYKMSQNYPNPFNPSTTIEYQLPTAGYVNLTVYNILGKKIKTLVDKFTNAGKHNVTFNAPKLPSGIYIYKITAGKFSEVRKMQLIK